MIHRITQEHLKTYLSNLNYRSISKESQARYKTNIMQFVNWLESNNKSCFLPEDVYDYREYLKQKGDKTTTINVKMSALNGLFKFMGYFDCVSAFLKNHSKKPKDGELTDEEYERILQTATIFNKPRTANIIQVMAETGVRVSELKYFTVESLEKPTLPIGKEDKVREINVAPSLKRKLKVYIDNQNIESGPIFVTRTGKEITRAQIWMDIKDISEKAGVKQGKINPQCLRRLYAINYFRDTNDVAGLVKQLGLTSLGSVAPYLRR